MSNYAPQSNDSFEKPYQAETRGEKKRSGCFKGCMIVGILGIVAVLTCCIGGFFYFRGAVKTDPVAIRAIAAELADSSFNDELSPAMGMSTFFMDMTIFADKEGSMLLMFHSPYMEANIEGADVRFRSSMEQNSEGEFEKTKMVENGEETITVKGEQVVFDFDHTQGEDTGTDYWEVSAVVPAEKGATIFLLRVKHDQYARQDVIDRLSSIK